MYGMKNMSPSEEDWDRLLSESFDRRTLLDMEAALDCASWQLPAGVDDHAHRTFIANRIVRCIVGGAHTEDAMTRAALGAVRELVQPREKD